MAKVGESGRKAEEADGRPRYVAFLSYAHADEKWGDWLHKRLEAYDVPPPGAEGAHRIKGKGTPLGKVFRDRSDLGAAHDLDAEIRKALEESGALIVVCSPRAAASRYVNEEIRYFKELGRGKRIFAAIVHGEPHAAGKPGLGPEDEAFPPALLYRLDTDGSLSTTLEDAEPVAADFRPGKDGRERGFLKLVAGLRGVALDELLQRHLVAEERKRQRTRKIATAMGALAVAAVVAAWLSLTSEQRARGALERAVAELAWNTLDEGKPVLAMKHAIAGWGALGVAAADYPAALGAAWRGGWNAVVRGDPPGLVARDVIDGWRTARRGATRYRELLGATLHRSPLPHPLGDGEIFYVADFSADGERAVTGSACGDVQVWDAATGTEIIALRTRKPSNDLLRLCESNVILSVALSPDGSRVVDVPQEGEATVWEVATGKAIGTLEGASVRSARFSTGGDLIIADTSEQTTLPRWWSYRDVGVWRSAGGEPITAGDFLISADGTHLVAGMQVEVIGSEDIFRLPPEASSSSIMKDPGSPALKISADGSRVVWPGGDAAQVWDVPGRKMIRVLRDPDGGRISDVDMSPSGKHVVTSALGEGARIWDVDSGTMLPLPPLSSGASIGSTLVRVSWSADESRIAAVLSDGSAGVWSDDGREIAVLRKANIFPERGVQALRLSPDGARAIALGPDPAIWTLASERDEVVVIPEWTVGVSADGSRLITVTDDGTMRSRDAADGREIARRELEAGEVVGPLGWERIWDGSTQLVQAASSVSPSWLSQDGRRLVTVSDGRPAASGSWGYGRARAWDTDEWRELPIPPLPDGMALTSFEVSPDGRHIRATMDDGSVHVWAIDSGREIDTEGATLASGEASTSSNVTGLDLGFTGGVAGVSPDGSVGSLFNQFEGAVRSPDGARVAARTSMRVFDAAVSSVVVWDVPSGREVVHIAHEASQVPADFSPDGSRLVALGADGVARIWSADTGELIEELAGHEGGLVGARFAAEGSRVVTWANDATTRIWSVGYLTATMPELVAEACSRFSVQLGGLKFTEGEINAEPLIREVWLPGTRDGFTDLCPRESSRSLYNDEQWFFLLADLLTAVTPIVFLAWVWLAKGDRANIPTILFYGPVAVVPGLLVWLTEDNGLAWLTYNYLGLLLLGAMLWTAYRVAQAVSWSLRRRPWRTLGRRSAPEA